MHRPVLILVVLCGALCCAAAAAAEGQPALRALAADGQTCWAVGDAGAVLRSDDAGRTWQRLAVPVAANFQAVTVGSQGVYFFGGQAVPAHPAGQGVPVILHTADAGRSFQTVLSGPLGWLYGGTFAAQTAVIFGQANPAFPAGIAHSVTEGRYWAPAAVYSDGFVLAGDFRTPRYGYLVGQAHRIVSLRNLAEPQFHPPRVASDLPLRGARFAGEETCWCVGDNGTILRSRPAGRPWDPIPFDLPPAARRCADLEAVAFASSSRAWVAGGLLGVLGRTDTAGGRWDFLPAPAPGAVHCLAAADANVVLAAGDGGRIWRSDDGAKTWQLRTGRERTDVLFIAAAGDITIYPALVAHSLAGLSAAVVYATQLASLDGVPPDQPLRAAAATAGAEGVTVLGEFDSVADDAAAEQLGEQDILQRWSARLDIPAEGEMLRQLAAAIRLYRPLVLAVGPGLRGEHGRLAENHLVSRLAREAAALAAGDGEMPELIRVGLRPWGVRRIFVGLPDNDTWAPPWQDPPRLGRRDIAVRFDTAQFPAGRAQPLELLAQAAVWCLPGRGLLDRPGSVNAYACPSVAAPVRLFTTGLAEGRLSLEPGAADQRDLATCTSLRLAIATRQIHTAASDLAAALQKAPTGDSAALVADRLLLAWRRLLDEGRLIEADSALTAFLKKGRSHPISQKMDVLALAAASSSEWTAQLHARGLPRGLKLSEVRKAAEGLDAWPAWSTSPAGRMLQAKALNATAQIEPARAILTRLAGEPYPPHWRRCALLELGTAEEKDVLKDRQHMAAAFVTEQGKLDGRLDEACWKTVPAALLLAAPAGEEQPPPSLTGTLQVVQSAAGAVIFGLRLPAAVGREWLIDVAVDADRDTWTQVVLHCDTEGRRRASLTLRDGPSADLGARTFQVQARQTAEEYTFEIAVAPAQFAIRPPVPDVWNFQLRATARDLARSTTLYFQPQPDPRLLPERYGLLRVPGNRE